MKYGSVRLEGNQVYSVGNPLPISVNNIEYMYVKINDSPAKIKRSALLAALVSAASFILFPIIALIIFPIVYSLCFYRIKTYELRVFINNGSGFGSKESCLHSSGYRDEYDSLIEQVKALKEAQ
ncbi:hypothetical protein L4C33_07625 [Vibrio makurazakiensis]|uniref:hypothetical protein n=1 Tax=Vibrio makurazakiensis TaxID=2910250 RepID=UPI003D11C838